MDKDKVTLLAFFGALLLIVIMLVSTIIQLTKISTNLKNIEANKNEYNSNIENSDVINSNIIKDINN